jgi:hypothetical protein
MFRQLNAVAGLETGKIFELLRETNQINLLLAVKDTTVLSKLIQILQPFAEATDLTQGDHYTTVGCVVPTVVCLHNLMSELLRTVRYTTAVVTDLQSSLTTRFAGLLANLLITANDGSPAIRQPDLSARCST